jgi:hypothetical protein
MDSFSIVPLAALATTGEARLRPAEHERPLEGHLDRPSAVVVFAGVEPLVIGRTPRSREALRVLRGAIARPGRTESR